MGRFVLLVALLAACKGDKSNDPFGTGVPGSPPKSEPGTSKPAKPGAPGSSYGGNGKPASWSDNGEAHGPGGPVFMGRGPDCDAKRDHCMRPGVFFGVDNMSPGKLYRATPIFELDGKWFNWRGKEEHFDKRFKTKVATKDTLQVGEPIIWFITEGSKPFVDVEYEALTSSRWEIGYVEELKADKVRVKGFSDAVGYDTIRIIVDAK